MPDLPGQFPPTPGIPSTAPRPKMKTLVVAAGTVAAQSALAEGLRLQGHTGKAAVLDIASAVVGTGLNLLTKNQTAQAVGQAMVLAPASALGRNYGGPLVASVIPKKEEKGTVSDFRNYVSQGQGTQTQTQASLQEQREEARVPAKKEG